LTATTASALAMAPWHHGDDLRARSSMMAATRRSDPAMVLAALAWMQSIQVNMTAIRWASAKARLLVTWMTCSKTTASPPKPEDVNGVDAPVMRDLHVEVGAWGLVDGVVELPVAGVVVLHETGDGDRVDVHMPTTI